MQTLRTTGIGSTVQVVRLHGEGAVKRRLMDMGITKGTEIYASMMFRITSGRSRTR